MSHKSIDQFLKGTSNMQKRQLAWYLIFGGLAIILLSFVTTILSFIGNHPFLGLALIAIGAGTFLLVFESQDSL
ncbi:MAG: hypothetical protein ABGX14_01270 [bacterium]